MSSRAVPVAQQADVQIGTILLDTLLIENELNSTVFVTQKNMPGAHIVSPWHVCIDADIKFGKMSAFAVDGMDCGAPVLHMRG